MMAFNEDESSDFFRINCYKIRMCSRSDSHTWRRCPYAHPNEESRRRDHTLRYYSARRCQPFMVDGNCPNGEECEFAHGDNEANFHPDTYRTLRCRYGQDCYLRFCYCAHNDEEDRRALVRERQLLRRRCQRHLRYRFLNPPRYPNQQCSNQPRFPGQRFSNQPRFPPQRFGNQPRFPHQQFLNQPRFPINSLRMPPAFWRREEPPQPPIGPRNVVNRSLSPPVETRSTNNGVHHHNQQQHQPDSRQALLRPEGEADSRGKAGDEAGSSNS